MKCTVCETETLRVCPDCNGPICLVCQQRYEFNTNPLICWICQNGIDIKWINHLPNKVRRTWPLMRTRDAHIDET